MHAPFVFRAAQGGDAMDDDLALPQRQVTAIEQTAAHEALEQARIAGQRTEQHQRLDAGRHQGVEAGLDFGGIGAIGGRDARDGGHGVSPVLCFP